MVELFTKAQADSRKGAEIGKQLLAARLAGGAPAGKSAGATSEDDRPTIDIMAARQGKV